jgi:LysR family hydrogen peroxide-inducible transcriptional activator
MQLVQIKYFLAACNTNNFTHAAKACNVTQPALTRSIGLLEEELGGRLFLREHHLTQLTPFGKMMRIHFEQILTETEKLRQAAKDYRLRHGATLNLGVLSSIGPRYFMDLFRDFAGANKNVQLTILSGDRDRLRELLLDGTLHLAITTRPETGDERLRWLNLYRERFVLAFPEGHRFQRMKSIGLTELASERHVVWCVSDYLEAQRAACREAELEFDTETECDREDWALGLVAAGIGVAILPESLAPAPGTVMRPILGLDFTREIHLALVEGRDAEAPVARFIQATQARGWAEHRRLAASQ